MNFKKYISKRTILRLLTVLTVMLLAVFFDMFHEGSEKLVDEMHQRSESQFQHSSHVFFYNQVSYFKVLKGADKLFSGFIFAATKNEFLAKYHNCRVFHLLKAESLKERPLIQLVHFMEFNTSHHAGPDDYPVSV